MRALTSSWNTNWEIRIIELDELVSGGPPCDGIPSIDKPVFVNRQETSAWLKGNEPVIALEINGDARAYPLQILTWHEIVNDMVGGVPVRVTFCPLCNSALVFERTLPDGQVSEFGVSGLLRNSDLLMCDRITESLWQQLSGEALVGDLAGAQLNFNSASMVSMDSFGKAYPNGSVLSRDTDFTRSYGRNPYAGYDNISQNPFLFDGELDERLLTMERVVAIALQDQSVAYPFSVLARNGVVHDTLAERNLVIFYLPGTGSALGSAFIAEGQDVGATGVFEPVVDNSFLFLDKATNLPIKKPAVAGTSLVRPRMDR